jgi:hypothetical protein
MITGWGTFFNKNYTHTTITNHFVFFKVVKALIQLNFKFNKKYLDIIEIIFELKEPFS